jgi:primary-amine oxidase
MATRDAVRLLMGLILTGTLGANDAAAAVPPPDPTIVTDVDHTFTVGTRWKFRVYLRNREGLAFGSVHYGNASSMTKVLDGAHLAQLHVPYLPGSPRFLDLDFGLGGGNAQTMTADECHHGTLYANNRVCIEVEDHGHAWKYGSGAGSYRIAETLSVFMSSQIGAYNYINKWVFHDDGSIEPQLGLTGQLQVIQNSAAYGPYGMRLNPETEATPRIGIGHMHNAYYYLNFGIDGAWNDVVARMRHFGTTAPSPSSSCSTWGECSKVEVTPILTEAAQVFSATGYTTWVYDKTSKNSDGRSRGYEIAPHISGLWRGMTATTEPWAGHDLWVTSYSQCEKYAVHNQGSFPGGSFCDSPSTPDHVAAMVNGGNVDGTDLVVWYANRHLHIPRDEDQPRMPIEWMSFHIKPRSFHSESLSAGVQ